MKKKGILFGAVLLILLCSFYVSAQDSPGVSLISPPNEATKSTGNISFNCSATDDFNLVNITLYSNTTGIWQAEETQNLTGTNGSVIFSINNISSGNYKWNCLVYDNDSLSNWGGFNYTFSIGNDTDNPSITLENPANNTLDSDGLILFTYNVTDTSSGIANCSLILNGNINKTYYTIYEERKQFFVLSDLTNGNYTWSINCSDNSDYNNIGSSEERIIEVVDNSTPIISLLDPGNGYTDKTGDIIFEYVVKDYGYNIANCSLIFNGTINQTNSSITESERQNFTINNLSYGKYEWGVNCTDTSPNLNQGSSYTFEVLVNKKPIVTLNTPIYNSTDMDGDIIFNFTVQDDGLLRNCTLYHDMNGTWLPNQSNTFVQPNVSLYFIMENAPNGDYEWNVICYDDARYPNEAWGGYSNFVLNINKTPPEVSAIPNLFWTEDDILILNLSNYFSDPKGDDLTYIVEHSDHVNITLNNETSIAILESEKNWFGNISVIFTAFDEHGMNVSSNNATFTVFEGTDTKPRFISISPANNSINNDGYIFFNCTVTDDYALTNISLYSNTTGNWTLEETKGITGLTNSTIFNITNLSDGYYQWACLAYDNASQTKWSDIYVVNVSIGLEEFYNTFPPKVVNNIDAKDAIIITYSYYLNNSILLGNLTIKESDDELYYTKNMSEESYFLHNGTDPWLIVYFHKIITNLTNIFDNNFSVGNSETLNISLDYWINDNQFTIYDNATIEIVESV